jgi:hypothetical protein
VIGAKLALGQIDALILNGTWTSVERARQQFLEAAADYEPGLLRSLCEDTYQLALASLNGGAELQRFQQPGTPEAKKLAAATKKWAVGWRLGTPTGSWCSAAAHVTVYAWLNDGERADFSHWAFPWVRSGVTIQLTPAPQEFSFKATWFDWSLDAAGFRRDTEARFKREFRQFVEKVAALRKDQGLKPPARKRESEHFYWLAQYQIGGLSVSEIHRGITVDRVDARDITPQAIQMAITRLAKLIGLTLRKPRSD